MKKIFISLLIFTNFIITGDAMENIINFDNTKYIINKTENECYIYLPEGETQENWHSQITREHIIESANQTEAAAEFAHKIQSKTPGASVLVYPNAATVGYLTFPDDKEYYEYSTVVFRPNGGLGLQKLQFSKRFYASEHGGADNARNSAINFAQQNNKKYMELINEFANR